jgi:RNA polymerase sigma factor (sigma-70 family)
MAPYRGVGQNLLVMAVVGTEALYRRVSERLWRSLYAYTHDRELTNDALSEAFTQLIARGDAVRDPEAWVWRAAFRIAAGELKRRPSASDQIRTRSYEMPDSTADVIKALGALPNRQRAVIVLHDYADRPAREVGEALGITRATVYVHLGAARRRLRELLEGSYG